MTIQLQMPNQAHLLDHVRENRQYCQKVVPKDWQKGKTVVICGAGPSLSKHHDEIRNITAHQVWACNSALPYMVKHGLHPTHGVTVDQSVEMYTVDWKDTFDVKYLVASCIDPNLTRHLLKDGRDLRWFHSYLGVKETKDWQPPAGWVPPHPGAEYEMFLYQTLWPGTVQVGYGLNTVPRAICLALWAGFKHIIVYGADCACLPDSPEMPPLGGPDYVPWLQTLQLYADGRSPHVYGDLAVMCEGLVDGRRWHTRPDMIISAVHLEEMRRAYPQIDLRGDTLPNAFKDKPPEFFQNELPHLTGEGGVSGFGIKHHAPNLTAQGVT